MAALHSLLIYGATGYTGRLIVERALARGLRPVVAGRDAHALRALGDHYGLPWQAAALDDPASLRRLTAAAGVLLSAAGPFETTSAPLIDACLATGTHYLDVTGEAGVIEAAARWHDAGVDRGVMLMPGVGFEIVASDCLAAHVAGRLPGATVLRLGYDGPPPMSRGSLKTSLGLIRQGVLVRRKGRLAAVAPGALSYYFDYGDGPQCSLAVSLGDVSSAFFSTGIPDIETYMRATLPVWGAVTATQYWGWLLATPPWQAFLKAQAEMLGAGPPLQARDDGWATFVAEAGDGCGRFVRSRLRTGDVYAFTAMSAIGVVERCLAGAVTPGFQTPSRVYGPAFALSFDGVSREDL